MPHLRLVANPKMSDITLHSHVPFLNSFSFHKKPLLMALSQRSSVLGQKIPLLKLMSIKSILGLTGDGFRD